ncbi:MAG: NCS2 family permease [Anaerolineaceae bacterium]|nr:MAG: NCS2 family permease [Anaerolineaceae bacterium]
MTDILSRGKEYFGVADRLSTVPTEILAGLSTFLSLSYIFIVNPAILANAGMDRSFVLFATIVASAGATLLMGFWARLPFVVAPGMEMNAYVAFFVVGTLGFSWQDALGAVFWSGVLCIIVTASRAREKIIHAIPDHMKSALSLSVGVFLALVALKVSGVLIYEGVKLRGVANPFSLPAAALCIGLVLILLLERLKVRAAVLIAIVLTSVFCHAVGIGHSDDKPAELSATMLTGIFKMNIGVILEPRIWSVVLILFLLDFYGSVAKFIGLTSSTNLMASGKLPRMREALYVDGVATVAGASLGTTSLITYVESGVGIGAGGRTGLTAITCGIFMLACFLVAPFLKYVPVLATTGALVFVAIKLCPAPQVLKALPLAHILVMLLMQLAVVAFFAIDKAMLVGFVAYIILELQNKRKPSPYLVASTILLVVGAGLQIMRH